MSNSVLNQLIELFPHVSEEFLCGIYDAHRGEDVTIEELVDVILLFNDLPRRNTTRLVSSASGCNEPVNANSEEVKLKVSSLENSREDRPVECEVMLNSSCIVNDVPPTCNVPSFDNKIDTLNCFDDNVSKEKNPTTMTKIKAEMNLNIKTEILTDEVIFPHKNVHTDFFCFGNQDKSRENGYNSSPECSIKYLLGVENDDYFNSNTKQEVSEDNSLLQNNKLISATPLLIGNLSNDKVNRKAFGNKKLIESCRYRKKSIRSNVNSSCQTTSHCSTKQATLRSCKVKNEEERLRRKLINMGRLFNERSGKPPSLHCSQFLNQNKKFTLLKNIFPDANPTFLLDQCEILKDHEMILSFISQNIELRDYPKREMVKGEPRLMEKFHCTVAEFLQEIPDPVEEFSSPNYVRIGYEENAEIYIKARYCGLSNEEIKQRLTASNYNLLSVCTQLESEGKTANPGVLDYIPLHHPANALFHQEVWYIEHRKEIQEYLESAIETCLRQQETNRPATPPVEAFECEICAEHIFEYGQLGTCDGANGHLFCKNCIKRSVEIGISEGKIKFTCLVNCEAIIPLQTVEEVLPKQMFDKLMGRIQEEEIRKANIAGVETCPFCPYAYGPGEEMLFTCLNPGCGKTSCRVCRMEDHSPDECKKWKEEDEEAARLIIENRMSEALMRTCHGCGKKIVKSGGCNKMQCNCGAKMCYLCRAPVHDYSHFNGPGGDNIDRCPLYSEEYELHVQPVQAVAQQVFDEIAANNPQLNLDRAKLIPQ